MTAKQYRYLYGPVSSWRLGTSLGIDPISRDGKVCTFDCVYCQAGTTRERISERQYFVPVEEIVKELKSFPPAEVDYLTFAGLGEPTLAKNLGEMIRAVKKARNEKVAVITNASLMDREDVRRDLSQADFVLAKLDAFSSESFAEMNRPCEAIDFFRMVGSIKAFKKDYKGKLALQIMFTMLNKEYVRDIAKLAFEIRPDEIQLNTPLRPSAAPPLFEDEMEVIERVFLDECGRGIPILNVYRAGKNKVQPVNEKDTVRRRGEDS